MQSIIKELETIDRLIKAGDKESAKKAYDELHLKIDSLDVSAREYGLFCHLRNNFYPLSASAGMMVTGIGEYYEEKILTRGEYDV